MAPGPVCVEPNALSAFGRAPIHHRTPEFEKTLKNCRDLLQKTFNTSRPVHCFTSTGSGAMEAAVVNFLSPGEKVLVVVSGKFGERWAQMLEAYGLNCVKMEVPWGKSIEVSQLKEELEKHKDIKAVYTQMCETSTGALHPIENMATIIKDYNENCLFCVDGITGVLTKEVELNKYPIDVLIAGSQKAFMLPTGLSLLYMSELAESKMEEASLPRFYFDLRKEKKAYEKGQTFFSSPVNLYFALEKSLEYIHKKGIKKHYREIEKRAHSMRGALNAIGLKLATEKPAPALTAFWVPDSIDGKKLRLHLEEKYRVTFMGGQDAWAGKIIRIGHIGFLSEADLQYAIESICDALNDFDFPVDKQKAMIAFEQSWDGSND